MERTSGLKRAMVRPQRHAAMKREEYMDYTDIIEELEEEEESIPVRARLESLPARSRPEPIPARSRLEPIPARSRPEPIPARSRPAPDKPPPKETVEPESPEEQTTPPISNQTIHLQEGVISDQHPYRVTFSVIYIPRLAHLKSDRRWLKYCSETSCNCGIKIGRLFLTSQKRNHPYRVTFLFHSIYSKGTYSVNSLILEYLCNCYSDSAFPWKSLTPGPEKTGCIVSEKSDQKSVHRMNAYTVH